MFLDFLESNNRRQEVIRAVIAPMFGLDLFNRINLLMLLHPDQAQCAPVLLAFVAMLEILFDLNSFPLTDPIFL